MNLLDLIIAGTFKGNQPDESKLTNRKVKAGFKFPKFKWNWTGFWVILAVMLLGLLSNESVRTIGDALLGTLVFGLPLGLLFAYFTKE